MKGRKETREMTRSILELRGVYEKRGVEYVDIKVRQWKPDEVFSLRLDRIPTGFRQGVRDNAEFYLSAEMNLGARTPSGLELREFDSVPGEDPEASLDPDALERESGDFGHDSEDLGSVLGQDPDDWFTA